MGIPINREHSKMTRIDNRAAELGLCNLSALEQDIWWALVREIKDKGASEIIISRGTISRLANSKRLLNDNFFWKKYMLDLSNKVVSVNTTLKASEYNSQKGHEEDVIIRFSIFPTFKIYSDRAVIKVSEHYQPWFNEIEESFTQIDLSVMRELKSKHAKSLYRLLARWRTIRGGNGYMKVDSSALRNWLGVPSYYSANQLKERIFDNVKSELLSSDENTWAPLEKLEIKPIVRAGRKQKVDEYEFNYNFAKAPDAIIKRAISEKNAPLPIGNPQQLGDSEVYSYENNFKKGYIPGKNAPATSFMKWLTEIKFFDNFHEYFLVRPTSKERIVKYYRKFVGKTRWSDMVFFATLVELVSKENILSETNFEYALNRIIEDKTYVKVSPTIYNTLPQEKQDELRNFIDEGIISLETELKDKAKNPFW